MLEVVDLFCGAGGMTLGLKQAGLLPRLGVDIAPDCLATYSRNFPKAKATLLDIADLRAETILETLDNPKYFVLAGCPPCQIFSKLQRAREISSIEGHIIFNYLRLLEELKPPFLVFENVPRIQKFDHVWNRLISTLRKSGYFIYSEKVQLSKLGVPQHRERLVILASIFPIGFPIIDEKTPKSTVRDAIGFLPYYDEQLPNHVTMNLSPANLERIRNTPWDGGISRNKRDSFKDSYARMYWDRVAPTITTKCVSFSNGRFGHPEFDRAITVREAALLQGFPMDFVFEGTCRQTARQVGNAVPPPLGRMVGEHILEYATSNLLDSYSEKPRQELYTVL